MKNSNRKRIKLGDVFEIPLPGGRFAYGRVYRDAAVGIYRCISNEPDSPPIGSRDFLFFVGMYRKVVTKGEWNVVGQDPFQAGEDTWPPPSCIIDVVEGSYSVYHRGEIRPATKKECEGLEIAAVWDSNHIIDRILHGKESKFLRTLSRM